MKKITLWILVSCLLLLCSCTGNEWMQNAIMGSTNEIYQATMKRDVLCLMMAYPDDVVDVTKDREGNVYVIMKSRGKILYDDKRIKSAAEKLWNGDIQDMMETIYPMGEIKALMPEDFDPGRIRVYPLLKEVYGGTKGQVERNMMTVKSHNTYYQFNRNNRAGDALKSVMDELIPLSRSRKNIGAFVFPTSGTFNYRYIAGTKQLSPHAFGIAIDLARDNRDYWKWASRQQGQKRLESYPREIVQIFEKNGFVWGGKWGHFDILHFEYRPELILKARYFKDIPKLGQPWYGDIPTDEFMIKKWIGLIDDALK